jgi:chromosome partitioning protein
VVDTPPQVTDSIRATITLTDLIILPVTPSPHDLRAVGATVDLEHGTGRPMIFVVNRAQGRARITADTAVGLSQRGMVAPVTPPHCNDFPTSMIDGRTVGELDPAIRSAIESRDLWSYIAKRLTKGNRCEWTT